MSKEELQKFISEETQNLPLETLAEILDFIQFIKSRKYLKPKLYKTKITRDLSELSETSLAHLENEFLNYKKLYPREQ